MSAEPSLLNLAGKATAFCLKAGLSGPLGRLSDEIIRDRIEEVHDRLSSLGQPKKHDLHLGVYRSMVQATLCTCLNELREMGVPDEKTFSFFSDRERKLKIAKRARGHEHVAWFEEVRQWCYAELQALRDPDKATTETLESIPTDADSLLGFGEEDAAQTLRADLIRKVLSRLETEVERSRPDAAGEVFEDRWPDRFTAFIREQYKEDDRFRQVLNGTLLSGLSAGQEQLGELFSDEIDTIRGRID